MSEGEQQLKLLIYHQESETDILKNMVDQLPQVPDTPIAGSQRVWFMEPIHQTSTPMVGAMFPPK